MLKRLFSHCNLLLATGLYLLATGVPAQAQSEGVPPAPHCDRITFSGYPDYVPWSWERDGELRGVSIRIAEAIAARLGREAAFVYQGPPKRVRLALRQGHVDAIVAVTAGNRDHEVGALSAFYGVDEIAIVHRADRKYRISGWDNLNGLRIATTLGSSWGNALDAHLKEHSELFYVSALENILRMVSIGRVDLGIHRYYSFLVNFDGHRKKGRVKMAYNRAEALLLYFNIARNSPCFDLLPDINRVLADLRRQGMVSREVQRELAALIGSGPSRQTN